MMALMMTLVALGALAETSVKIDRKHFPDARFTFP